ncbi:MAG: PAS domain-containing protein, partial [candidate division Zixibacteria bacterium]|nr:PAS domain-containing protein [candidate division Zixibacteria bacterium]
RRKAEKTLSGTIKQYTAMIDTVPALLYAKDAGLKYIVVNHAFCNYVNCERDDVIGKTDEELFSDNNISLFNDKDLTVLQEEKKFIGLEEQYTNEKGEPRWNSLSKAPIRDNKDKVVGLVGMMQDITEQRKARDQLMQSDKLAAIGTLAAGVAHEINNPMGYISSNLNTMLRYIRMMNSFCKKHSNVEDEEHEEVTDILEDFEDAINESIEGASRVKHIVTDLKSFSRVDKAEKEHADINEGVKSTLNIVWNELKYHCKVETDYGDIPDLYCMPNQINQVFMNLLMNAGQAIKHKEGLIKIKTWADDKNVYVSIKDNGSGISEEKQKKIFEPFYTTKDVGKGTGLGLSLVYDIIKKHHGQIDVNSQLDIGSEFIVALPLKGMDHE